MKKSTIAKIAFSAVIIGAIGIGFLPDYRNHNGENLWEIMKDGFIAKHMPVSLIQSSETTGDVYKVSQEDYTNNYSELNNDLRDRK